MNINRFIAIETIALFAVCLSGLVCCHTSSNPPPEPPVTIVGSQDAADASAQVATACTKIASMCAIQLQTCTSGMGLALADPVHPFIDFPCITNASTKQAMQGCGGVGIQGCP